MDLDIAFNWVNHIMTFIGMSVSIWALFKVKSNKKILRRVRRHQREFRKEVRPLVIRYAKPNQTTEENTDDHDHNDPSDCVRVTICGKSKEVEVSSSEKA